MDITVISYLPPQRGRLSDYGTLLCRSLAERHTVTVVTQQDPGPDPVPGCRLAPVLDADRPARLLTAARQVNATDPDAVLYNYNTGLFGNSMLSNAIGAVLPRLITGPVTTLLHSTVATIDTDAVDRLPAWLPDRALAAAEQQTVRHSDQIIVPLERFRHDLADHDPGGDPAIHIPHGTPDIDRTVEGEGIVAAGYWSPDKMLETLLERAPEIRERLTVVGGSHPDHPGHLDRLQQRYPAVTFTGHVPEDRYREELARSRYTLVTNRTPKGTSGVLNYAAAAGSVPIVLQGSGMPAIARAEGYQVLELPPDAPGQLPDLLEEQDDHEIAAHNREQASDRTFDDVFRRIEDALEDMAE